MSRGRRRTAEDLLARFPEPCPRCSQPPGRPCSSPAGLETTTHRARLGGEPAPEPLCPCGEGDLHHLCGMIPVYSGGRR